jgi:hypothetical protein
MDLTKKNLERMIPYLMVIATIGGFLFYMEILIPLAFIVTAVPVLAIIFIYRHLNSLPISENEKDNWEKIRAQGRKEYLFDSLKIGIFLTVICLVFQLGQNFYYGKPTFYDFTLGFVIALLLFIFAPLYAASEMWKFNEQRFNESQTLPNNEE